MELKDLDLNLLVVFEQLLAKRSVSRAADNLGLTQPAVSNALGRLRRLLGDELFERTSSGMAPTPLAERLAEPVAHALGLIHAAVNERTAFDPRTTKQRFTIGMTDIGEIDLLPALMKALGSAAPSVTLATVRHTAIDLRHEMEAGRVDVAFGLLPQLQAGFFQRRLFTQRYVCLMRRGHRLDAARLSLADFSAAEHVVVESIGTGHGKVDELLVRAGVARQVRLTVPHFVAIGHILQDSDLIATVPERLAQKLAEPFGLSWVRHPAKLPPIAINLFWHARCHKDPANEWLRALLVRIYAR